MSRYLLLFALSLLCVFALAGCAGAASGPAGGTPAEAPTRNPRTPLPLPPQPTSPPLPVRATSTLFPPATFAPIVGGPTPGQVAATAVPTAAPTRAATAAGAAPTQPAAGPVAPGVATGVRTALTVEFVAALSTPEEVDEIEVGLRRTRGIIDVSGNERTLTVGYDAGLILPGQIRALLDGMKHAVKP